MSTDWMNNYQYINAKGFPSSTYQNTVKASKVPKKLFEQCIPKCFPPGASTYSESMMKCASNCKTKIIESYQMFNSVYTDRLSDEGYVLNEDSKEFETNSFKDMKVNQRLLNAKQNFEIHTIPDTSKFM